MELVRHTKTVRVKNGKEQQYKPMAKHAMKVHVWAAISKCGATKVCMFNQIMNAQRFMLTFWMIFLCHVRISAKFPDGHCFMQDNDLKHTSQLTKAYLKDQGINWWHTPVISVAINPIERVWAELQQYIAR